MASASRTSSAALFQRMFLAGSSMATIADPTPIAIISAVATSASSSPVTWPSV
ncbi:hypothetical protein ACVOMV_33710 [Mesorhizobium atlanticum]